MNINILGVSELKWTGMGEFNSDDHYTYHCGQESLRRNGVVLIVNKSLKCSSVQFSHLVVSDSLQPHELQHTRPPCPSPSPGVYMNAVPRCNLKNDRMISVCFQGKPFHITVIQVCAPTSNAEEADVERFYEDLQDLLELTPKKDVLFIIGDWNAKLGIKSYLE